MGDLRRIHKHEGLGTNQLYQSMDFSYIPSTFHIFNISSYMDHQTRGYRCELTSGTFGRSGIDPVSRAKIRGGDENISSVALTEAATVNDTHI